jgi:biopolymer transport protein ExbD
MEERVEKTLIIKPNRSVKYGDVVKVVDAVRGAGASPVVLQIDDLPDGFSEEEEVDDRIET